MNTAYREMLASSDSLIMIPYLVGAARGRIVSNHFLCYLGGTHTGKKYWESVKRRDLMLQIFQ